MNTILRLLLFKKVLKTYVKADSKKSDENSPENELDINNVMTVDIEQCLFLVTAV